MFSVEKKNNMKSEIIREQLCEKYNQYYRMAYSYVHNDADACDIVQEGAYKAMRYCHTLRNAEHVSTWLYRIMMNEIFRHLSGTQTASLDNENVQEPSREDQYTDFDLQRALDTLPVQDKAIVQMKYFDGLKLEEIASILDENVNTIKSRLYRALKKLKIELA